MYLIGLEGLSLSLPSPDCTTLNWTGKYHTGQSVHCTSLDWSAPKCIARFQMKLTKTVLRCTWMYFIGLDHTGYLCTVLEVSSKDCAGLPKLQWSWWQYITLHLTYMQKTASEDGWYTDVLRKDQLNKKYIKPVSVSIIQDNSCFEHTNYVTADIVLVVLELSQTEYWHLNVTFLMGCW